MPSSWLLFWNKWSFSHIDKIILNQFERVGKARISNFIILNLSTVLLMLNHCYWYTLNENINLKMFGSGWKECVSNEFNFIFIVLSEQKIVSSILWKRHFLKETLSDIAQINSIQIYHWTMKYTLHLRMASREEEKNSFRDCRNWGGRSFKK